MMKAPYIKEDLVVLLTQACSLGRELETALQMAVRAAGDGNQEKAGLCMDRANILMGRIGSLGTPERTKTGRPPAKIRKDGDRTLGQIRNSLRLCVPAGTIAGQLGISESTFRRRMRKTQHLTDEVLFSQIP